MASSPADPVTAVLSPTAFALQEIIACWDQGYEALARGDLERLSALMDVAGDHLGTVGDGSCDSELEARLRNEAVSARGRLEHGMRAGLAGLGEEIARTRRGSKMLRGYADPAHRLGGNYESRL